MRADSWDGGGGGGGGGRGGGGEGGGGGGGRGGREVAYTFSLLLLIGEVNQVQPRSHLIGWTD